ncbi:nitrogenase component 1 [Wukongibacter sp. M2B1]|uniref:nitrogenase component 1 n=1 Tax=Wukongibacter sp. M2B1 TaxID=3088895 RepID=UPI003D7BD822
MKVKPYSIPIGKLKKEVSGRENRIYPDDILHYCSPSVGGWGVVRVACLVPEAVVLFVIPQGCGRHGAIASYMHKYNRKLFYIYLSEVDLVTGCHMEKINKAVERIIYKHRPKALLLCHTCVDDLLGSDYEAKAYEIEEKYGIPVRIGTMNPIKKESKKPPELMIQNTIYGFLKNNMKKENTINVIGSFANIDSECEIHELMRGCGYKKLLHIRDMESLDSYMQMAKSKYAFLIKPSGSLAVKHMKKSLNIDYVDVPVSYRKEDIRRNYELIGNMLGVKMDVDKYERQSEDVIRESIRNIGKISVAIGTTANACPFELARELVERDIHVPYVFADQLMVSDYEHVDWLSENASYMKVYTTLSPSMISFIKEENKVDIAIGFDAGYFCSESKTVPLSVDEQPYGYKGVEKLYSRILETINKPQNFKREMYQSGLVI